MTASRIVFAAFVWLGGATAFAQIPVPTNTTNGPDQQAPSSGTNDATRDDGAAKGNQAGVKPDPNKPNNTLSSPKTTMSRKTATDDQKEKSDEPEIGDDSNLTPEQKASVEYAGPAVLSRGITASQPMNPKNLRFTPQVTLDFTETSGLNGINLSNPSGLQSGVNLSYGVVGAKVLKKDTISLTYLGSLNHYFNASGFDSNSNQLSFSWTHMLSKRLQFGLREQVQEFNENTVLTSGSEVITSGIGTTLVTASPATEVFDGRVLSLVTEGSLTYYFSPRLSLNFSGAGFETRRYSSSLYGNTGYQATGDVLYRFTKRVSAGVYYGYTHFDFIGIYGASDINSVGAEYSIAFSRRTQLSTRFGGSRIESTGVENYTIPAALAALLGFSSTSEAAYQRNYAPEMSIQLTHQEANLSLHTGYSRGVTPGNGIILTSVRQMGDLGANYKTRRWNYATSIGYDTLAGFGTTNQRYQSVFANASVYRSLAGNLAWHMRFDFHHYLFDSTGFLRNSYTFATGVAWSPGDLLNRVW
jgi:hypothetical protein